MEDVEQLKGLLEMVKTITCILREVALCILLVALTRVLLYGPIP